MTERFRAELCDTAGDGLLTGCVWTDASTCEDARELLDIETFWFETGQTGSTEIRKRPYANMRLGRIADAVGEATVREIWKQEEAVDRRKMGGRRWRIFTEGSHEEWEQIQDETYSASTSSDPLWGVAYSRVQELAVTEFADLPAREFARALRSAADAIAPPFPPVC